MKKMIIMAVAIIISVAANAKSVLTSEFSGIRVNVPADVRIVRGDKYGVAISSDSKAVENAVQLKVTDGILRISTRDLDALPENTKLRITVMVPADCDVKAGKDVVINSTRVYDTNGNDIAMK